MLGSVKSIILSFPSPAFSWEVIWLFLIVTYIGISRYNTQAKLHILSRNSKTVHRGPQPPLLLQQGPWFSPKFELKAGSTNYSNAKQMEILELFEICILDPSQELSTGTRLGGFNHPSCECWGQGGWNSLINSNLARLFLVTSFKSFIFFEKQYNSTPETLF